MPELSLLGAFIAGLLGGVHCVGMCGGLVTAFTLGAPGRSDRLSLQLTCNFGRITTYAALGLLAGTLGSGTAVFERVLPVQRILFAFASLMLIGLGLYLAGVFPRFAAIESIGTGPWRLLQPALARLLPIDSPGKALAAGALWGFLPCGLVYSATVLALASGSAARGALVMAAFGLGTLPNLLAIGLVAGRLASFLQDRRVRRLAGAVIAGFGAWGMARLLAA